MIPIIYSPLHKKHTPTFEVYDGVKSAYPEVADRIEGIKEALVTANAGTIIPAKHFSSTWIKKIHNPNYVAFLQKKTQQLTQKDNFFASYFIMDTYAPITGGTYQAAVSAVDVALTGAKLLQQGEKILYSLSRPPGHHAGYVNMGGYCYFNNAAVAAEYLSTYGKVAILDIDYHHGNGTQQAFYDRDDVLYVSLHANPTQKFPYISGFASEIGVDLGKGYTKNYPLPLATTELVYHRTLVQAVQDVAKFKPTFLIVSAGFDTYKEDPIGSFRLDIPFYRTVGKTIASLSLPTLVIQEGGYNVAKLGDIAVSFISGLQFQAK